MKILIIIIVLLAFLFILGSHFYLRIKTDKMLALADKKINDFKNKNFSSQEEKEIAKQELKDELLKMKKQFTTLPITSEKFNTKIMSL